VDILEELRSEVIAEVRPFVDRAAVVRPCGVDRLQDIVAQAISMIVRLERAVEEEDTSGEGWREEVLRRVEYAFTIRAEPAECDAEGITQVVGGWLGVELGFVGGEWCALGAVGGGLSPGLGVTPGRGARFTELNGGFTT